MPYEIYKERAKVYRQSKINNEGFRLEYALMMLMGAAQAEALGHKKVTAIEFGVYTGHGLIAMSNLAKSIEHYCGIEYQIFGFDTYAGMPPLNDYRDHPEIWQEGSFEVESAEAVQARMQDNVKIIAGEFTETVPAFSIPEVCVDAPLAFVAIDCDLYHSAKTALQVLQDPNPSHYIPAVMTYFDDVHDIVTLNPWCGEALAIDEFNQENAMRKIEHKDKDLHGHYVCHVLDHPVRNGTLGRPHGSFDIRLSDF